MDTQRASSSSIYHSTVASIGLEAPSESRKLRLLARLPIEFTFEELRTATNDFKSKKLGSSGSGSVFMGVLEDESSVAVKRVERLMNGQVFEFEREISTLACIQHVNLVRLRGYCSYLTETEKAFFVVYDFLPNGSLNSWIFPPVGVPVDRCLPWKLRYKVAIDIAKALSYLHYDCSPRILHLDIKPDNILLDGSYRAVVSDFGMSRLMDEDRSEAFTVERGTQGYIAPEWRSGGEVSEKCDIYSYGQVLLDLFFGMRYVCLDQNGDDIFRPHSKGGNSQPELQAFHNFMQESLSEKKLLAYIDKRLLEAGGVNENEVSSLVDAALLCLKEDPEHRLGDMRWVVKMLEEKKSLHGLKSFDQYNYLQNEHGNLAKWVHNLSSGVLHKSHLRHYLESCNLDTVYRCDGCKEYGSGLRYRCELCDFDLHRDCMFSSPSKYHPFYTNCNFRFMEKPLGEHLQYCNACGNDIEGSLYHCTNSGRQLHPCCTNFPLQITCDEIELYLSETVLCVCAFCGRKELHARVAGLSYASTSYNFHISCIKKMVQSNLESNIYNQNTEHFTSFSARLHSQVPNFASDVPNLQQILLSANASRRLGRSRNNIKVAVLFIQDIACTILGDPVAGIRLIESLLQESKLV